MTKLELLKGLGCLQKASEGHSQGELSVYYDWREFHPLVWTFFLGYLLQSCCGRMLKMLLNCFRYLYRYFFRDPAIKFWSKIFHERLPSPVDADCPLPAAAIAPKIGDWYYYPYYNGIDFIPATQKFSASNSDLQRLGNETYCRYHAECIELCKKFNEILTRKIYSK